VLCLTTHICFDSHFTGLSGFASDALKVSKKTYENYYSSIYCYRLTLMPGNSVKAMKAVNSSQNGKLHDM